MKGLSEDTVFQMVVTAIMSKFGDDSVCSESKLRQEVIDFVNEFEGIDRARVRDRVFKELETRINVEMTVPVVLDGQDTCPWLTDEQAAAFQNGYWKRYASSLVSKRGKNSITDLDRDTSAILTRCGNPQSDNAFQKKGLVVGDVQSGKTSNYTGLICKAADVGYKIIIVVAGIHEKLRQQTQERLELDFTGELTNPNSSNSISTVSIFDGEQPLRKPRSLTTYLFDFDSKAVQQQSPDFDSGDIILLVIKKNTKILDYVNNFFKKRVPASVKRDFPVLLIDDEADNASINSKRQGETPTAINAKIRSLLSLFHKTSYVGYTATPYANIFINPDISGDPSAKENRMDQQDLFPKDFIYCLMRPNNYFGAARLFEEDEDGDPSNNMVQSIPVEEEFLHDLKQGELEELPESLVRALYTFILTVAIKSVRRQDETHTSMLVNVSSRIRDHQKIAKLVENKLSDLKSALNYIRLSGCETRTPELSLLHDVWMEQFEKCGVKSEWRAICRQLGEDGYLATIKVHVQNSRTPKDSQLDYTKAKGQRVILIGGNSLSRGLTLEGLTTSYFLRTSRQYDTLMQMGRWFGYRSGYEDLCRVFMTVDMQNNFAAISRATDELKDSIREMNKWGMTPLDFGLRVRNAVSSLIVTAPNKMRSTTKMRELVDFSDQMVETYCISSEKDVMEANCRALMDFLSLLDTKYQRWSGDDISNGWIWENVSSEDIKHYLQSNRDMWASVYVDEYPMYVEIDRLKQLDVCFVSLESQKRGEPLNINGTPVYPFTRLPYKDTGKIMRFTKDRFFSKSHEMGHISKEALEKLKAEVGKPLAGKDYRKVEGRRPLLIVAFARVPDCETIERCRDQKIKLRQLDINQFTRLVAAYGISFPFDPNATKKSTTWVCNSVFTKELFPELDGDDDDDYEDDKHI